MAALCHSVKLLPQPNAQGTGINEKKSRSGRPAKIAPLKPPKEIHDNTTPRCAMEATLSDHQILELDESQEGKYAGQIWGWGKARI
jgi:hypothetical protein